MALRLSATLHPQLDLVRSSHIVEKIPIFNARPALSPDSLIHAMQTDKKTLAGKLRFVLLDSIGHAYVESNANREAACKAIEDILNDLEVVG